MSYNYTYDFPTYFPNGINDLNLVKSLSAEFPSFINYYVYNDTILLQFSTDMSGNQTDITDELNAHNENTVEEKVEGTNILIDASDNITGINNVATTGYLLLSDITAPSNPSSGEGLLYKKTGNDGIFWRPDASGNEVDLTDTSSGPSNSTYTRTEITNAESPYTILSDDEIIGIDTTSGAVTVTLPQISGIGDDNYKKYFIVDEGGNASSNKITLSTTGGDTINTSSSPLIIRKSHTALSLYSDGTSNWVIF